MNKHLIFAICLLLAGYSGLVGSDVESGVESCVEVQPYELTPQAVTLNTTEVLPLSARTRWNEVRRRSSKAVVKYGRRVYEGDCETLKATGCCCFLTALITAAITCGVLFAGHTTTVCNRTEDTLTVSYRPGCSEVYYTYDSNGNRIKHTKTVDCKHSVSPNDHIHIYNFGQLTKLCVTKAYGYGSNMACATQEGLKHNYKWHAHYTAIGSLTLTRGKGGSVPTFAPTLSPSWNSADSGYIADVAPTAESYEDVPSLEEVQ